MPTCFRVLAIALLFLAPLSSPATAQIRVDTNFPGGSAQVQAIDPDRQLLRLTPSDHPGKGWACWWYARITGLDPAKPLHLVVGNTHWATPDRAAISYDGQSWTQSRSGTRNQVWIEYLIPLQSEELWVAWGPPFVPEDASTLVRSLGARPGVEPFNLCTTREGRATPALRFINGRQDAPAIWIQARQHAWEAGSSWVAKGLIEWLASDAREAKALRQGAEITVIPIMDIDNVHRGAGGKNQLPQDHNRDWTAQPYWRAVEAAQTTIRTLDAEGRLLAFIDLRNPGARDRFPYYYVPPKSILSPQGQANLRQFLGFSQQEMRGPLRFIGRAVESGSSYDPKAWKAISKNWVAANCRDQVVSVTLETAWNTPSSTIEGYEILGQQLGQSLAHYVEWKLSGAE